ncbi:MAG: MFS transporter [Chloroflexota bacterium]
MKQGRVFYGWVVVGVAFISLAIAYAIWNSFSIFLVAISADFGWSRGSTAAAFSIFTIVYAVMSPVAGVAVDRFGPRVVVPLGAFILAAGLFTSSRVEQVWQLYVGYGIFTAIGVNLIGTLVNFSVLANWFSRRRGTATGLAAAGIGVGTLILVPGSQMVINLAGWRMAYVVLAVVTLVAVPWVAMVFYRHHPEEMGLLPDGGSGNAPPAGCRPPAQVRIADESWARREWSVGVAVRTRAFWMLFVSMMAGTVSHQSVMIHQVAYLTDRGFDPMLGASLVGMVGLFGSVGKVFWGWISDRIGREVTWTLGMGCVILGVIVLWTINDVSRPWVTYLYAGLFGFGYGVNAPLCSAAAADLFQGKRFGSIYGALYVGSGTGSSLGPWLSGVLFDLTGAYFASIVMSVIAGFISVAAFWIAAPRKVREVPGVAARSASAAHQGARVE